MPDVDCWRRLGVTPGASAEEVRAGFARRVREVHPDSGGTGDALAMRLLVEARDEALGLVGGRAGGGTRRSRGERGHERAAGGERRCHVCGQVLPRSRLSYKREIEGSWKRASRGQVLMCWPCSSRVWTRRRRAARLKAVSLIVGFGVPLGAMVLDLLPSAHPSDRDPRAYGDHGRALGRRDPIEGLRDHDDLATRIPGVTGSDLSVEGRTLTIEIGATLPAAAREAGNAACRMVASIDPSFHRYGWAVVVKGRTGVALYKCSV